MASSKDNFINRMNSYDKAISSESVISKAFTEIEHNLIARLLRNGLSIIAFTILEDFLKTRTGEVFKSIGTSSIPFSRLPAKIQEASTISAIKSIQTRASNLKKTDEDWLGFIQEECGYVGSTKSSVYELSSYSMGWDKSNLVSNDISDFLNCFKVAGGWSAIQQISNLGNITLAVPSDTFKGAAMRRHNSAHNAAADTPINDLTDFSNQSRIIAFCFDALISKSLHYILSNDLEFIEERKTTNPSDIKLRFLLNKDNRWKEFSQGSSRAFRTNKDYNIILPDTKSRTLRNSETLLIKDASNKIIDWFIK